MAQRRTSISDADFLKAAATVKTGKKLGEKLGISPTAVSIRRRRLLAQGVSIEFAKNDTKPDQGTKLEVEHPLQEEPEPVWPTRGPESGNRVPGEPDRSAAYWFDVGGKLDVQTRNGIQVSARFVTTHKLLADMFHGRYGGAIRNNENAYAVLLSQDNDGLHQLVCDLAVTSVRYGELATKLCQWLEYRFYLLEQERQLLEEFRSEA